MEECVERLRSWPIVRNVYSSNLPYIDAIILESMIGFKTQLETEKQREDLSRLESIDGNFG
jgi:hypothetical protein